ncbi:MAG: DUF2723 domain-containing protein [Calditrichaeota bacterium]|nr:DUF2723 domain-containing protein [Calditrichota bacterium]
MKERTIRLTAHKTVAAIIFIIVLVNILATIAPTTSFWDCGEFISASYTLGVPHPPGAPLFLLLGRLFSMLPLGENIGYRVNLVSALFSAFTILLLYLSIVRIIRTWRGKEESLGDMITVYGSAAVGALSLAFSTSFWFNAVEAEVYAGSLFFTALAYYLALVWMDYSDVPRGNRILLFLFYVVGLSSGIHLLNVLTLIAITYLIAYKKRPITLGNFIVIGVIGSLILFTIYPTTIQGLPLLVKKTGVWSVVVLLAVLSWLSIYFIRHDKRIPAFSALSLLLVIIGYSTYMFVIIRSGLDPFLDENDPETWSGLLAYLNREQYGSESLFATMFERKAPFWSYQINKMYIRYFNWQFVGTQAKNFYALPLLLGILGAVHHFYKEKKGAIAVSLLFFMTGLAIILYVNQDDPQPRERDYSYVGSFYAFAIWIGIGVTTIIELVHESFKKIRINVLASTVTIICLLIVPAHLWVKNYQEHDRSGNYVAWDYSYNLLESCEPNAILYTNGDNDTFPLWYLQVVEGVRTDVRVANLSLLNTGWFIRQIRDKYPKVPMPPKITDSYIDNVIESRDVSGLMDRHWQQVRKVSINGPTPESPKLVWDVPATLSYPVGAAGAMEHFLKVQDMMILNTLATNNWERPIYFAVTVSDANLLGLRNIRDLSKNFLSMEGLAFKLHPTPVPLINSAMIEENMFNRYKYRGVNDPDVYFNNNIQKLLGNYRQGLIQLAFQYIQGVQDNGDSSLVGATSLARADMPLEQRIEIISSLSSYEKALTALEFMEYQIPEEIFPIKMDVIAVQIGRIYAMLGKPEEMKKRLDAITNNDNLSIQQAYEYGIFYLSEAADPAGARRMFDFCLDQFDDLENYRQIASIWLQMSNDDSYPQEIFRKFLLRHNDRQSKVRVASLALSIGLNELAFSIYEPMWLADPGDKAAVDGLIQYYQLKGNYERAMTLVNDWLGAYPSDAEMQNKRERLASLMENKTQ